MPYPIGAVNIQLNCPLQTMHNLFEWYMGCLLYSSLVENTAAELSARMNSMENATKNAGEIYVCNCTTAKLSHAF